MNAHTNHDAFTAAPPGYSPLPAGDYQLELVESDYGPAKSRTGTFLKTKAQVVGGEYAGRTVFINYCLDDSTKPEAEEIGQRDFLALRRAIGVLSVSNTEQLHFKTFGVKMGNRVSKDTKDLPVDQQQRENFIKEYVVGPVAVSRTSASDFMFDLEGELYKLEALSTTLEALLLTVVHDMSKYDRGRSAAIDMAVVELADTIRELAERYEAVSAPKTAPEPTAEPQRMARAGS